MNDFLDDESPSIDTPMTDDAVGGMPVAWVLVLAVSSA